MGFKIEVYTFPESFDDGNMDVFVLTDNKRYVATFFTFSNINTLINRYKKTGELLNGKYFWSSNMMLVSDLHENTIVEVVEDLIEKDEFLEVFDLIEDNI
ncbi:hypothetical protein [Tenacibaculum sp. 190524A02b]|uniref:hypothetical protein n=1 Tax=Tenacibaculum vairaonense TaxID=3137860 RepID=UPI0031FB34EA